MKKIVMICAILMAGIVAFAQSTKINDVRSGLSPKELMKMQVVGINPGASTNRYEVHFIDQSLS